VIADVRVSSSVRAFLLIPEHHPLPVAPGSWLGLLGGGQLGRMFCMAAQSLGYKVAVVDPGNASPAGSV